jgi:Arc/MetJ-type ribon-helix-helix transcriptional regulator
MDTMVDKVKDRKKYSKDNVRVQGRVPRKARNKVHEFIDDGLYKSESDAIARAIQLLIEHEEDKKKYDIRTIKIK